MGQIGGGGLKIAAVAGQLLGGHGQQLLGTVLIRIGGAAEGIHVDHGMPGKLSAEILPQTYIITQLTGNETGLKQTVQLKAHFFCAGAGSAVEAALVADHNNGVLRDIIGGGSHLRIGKRHIAVRSGVLQPVFVFFQILGQGFDQRFIGIFPAALPGDQQTQIFAQTIQPHGMQPGLGLAYGQYHHLIYVFAPALAVRIKVTHGIQLVTVEFGTERTVSGRGEDVQNTAANRKLTGAFHHGAAAVTGTGQPDQQSVQIVFPAHLQLEDRTVEDCRGHGSLAEGFPTENLQFGGAGDQIVELAQAFLLPGAGDNGSVVQGQIPAGENLSGGIQESFQLLLHSAGSHVILTDDDDGTIQFLGQSRDHVAAVDLSDSGNSGRLPFEDSVQKGCVFRNGLKCTNQFIHSIPRKKFLFHVRTRKGGNSSPFPW